MKLKPVTTQVFNICEDEEYKYHFGLRYNYDGDLQDEQPFKKVSLFEVTIINCEAHTKLVIFVLAEDNVNAIEQVFSMFEDVVGNPDSPKWIKYAREVPFLIRGWSNHKF